MVTITRRLAGVVPYSAIYFPDARTVRTITDALAPTRIARLFFTSQDVAGRCVIARYFATTVNSDLTVKADDLWKATHNDCRQGIRRAQKLGDRVSIERNGANGQRDFMDLLVALARSKEHVTTISPRRLALLGDNADLFVAYLDGRAYCAHLYLKDPVAGRARELHSATRRAENPGDARTSADLNRLLHWHEIQLYREEGFRTYDLGGIAADAADGRARFKLSFGGEIAREHVYLCTGMPRLGSAGWRLFEAFTNRGRQWRARTEELAGQ
jgi:hypothetical protein